MGILLFPWPETNAREGKTINKTKSYRVIRHEPGSCRDHILELIGEEPFLIRVDDKPYSVVMRTPGDEVRHVVGFCLGEGLIRNFEDIETLGYDQNLDANIADVWLTPLRREKIKDRLERKSFVSQTSCGICGKEMIKDLEQVLKPATDGFEITLSQAFDCVSKLSKNQKFYQITRGSHAALIFDERLEVIAFAEDVGRHNALDKAIGKTLLNKSQNRARLVVMSSRISYELVQKAARARIPIMISNSRPTAMAADMGKNLNMTLAFPAKALELMVVCGEHRIKEHITCC